MLIFSANMGAYLSAPITEKETFSGEEEGWLQYGGASMQGWRRSQEDAHSVHMAPGFAFFSIFDGHGGAECSAFTKKYMLKELLALREQMDLTQALIEVFHKMDSMLKEPRYRQEIEELKRRPADSSLASLSEPPSRRTATVPVVVNSESKPEDGDLEQPFSKVDALKHLREMLSAQTPSSEKGQESLPPADAPPRPSGSGAAAGVATATHPVDMEASAAEASLPGPTVAALDVVQAPAAASTSPAAVAKAEGAAVTPRRASYDDAGNTENLVQAGCTAVVAVIEGTYLYIANAGDSRAIICRDTTAVPLSQDHKPASQSERERIQAAGGFISEIGGVVRVNGNLNLSRAIGDLRYKDNDQLPVSEQIITAEPDIVKEELVATDRFLVLACDGVWDVKSNQEVVDFVRERLTGPEVDLADVASQLLDECLAPDPRETRGIGCDNMTCLIVVLDPAFERRNVVPPTMKMLRGHG